MPKTKKKNEEAGRVSWLKEVVVFQDGKRLMRRFTTPTKNHASVTVHRLRKLGLKGVSFNTAGRTVVMAKVK